MTRLVKLFAANIVTTQSIEALHNNLNSLRCDNVLDQEHIGIGRKIWFVVSAVEQI